MCFYAAKTIWFLAQPSSAIAIVLLCGAILAGRGRGKRGRSLLVIGLVALRLSDRLAPWEDPDALVRQSIEVMLAGFQKVPPRGGDAPEGTFHQACRPSR